MSKKIELKIVWENKWLFLTIAFLAIFVVLKGVGLDMTHDEAYSFYNVKHFWWVETLCTGNTHWFNFAAIKLSVLCGLEKAWQLRWFSYLSAFVFLGISAFWVRSFSYNSIKIFAFCLLLLNPYMLDYFSLARGYAAGIAFQALSLFFFYKSLNGDKRLFSLLALGFGGLSAIANFNFYYFFVGFSVVYFFQIYCRRGFSFLKKIAFYVDAIYFILISALVLKALQFITVCSNDIGPYGGDAFVDSLFSGYVKGWAYDKFKMSSELINAASYVVMVVVLTACAYGIFKFKKHRNSFYMLTSIILLSIYGLCVINRNLFQVLYPVDRTTLMVFPLMALAVVYFISELAKEFKFVKALAIVLSLVITANFFSGLSLDSTYDYKQQIDAKESFNFVERLGATNVGISGDLYGVYRNYYQMTEDQSYSFQADYIETNTPKGLGKTGHELEKYQYLILYPPYDLSYYRNNAVSLSLVTRFANSGTLILKVNAPVGRDSVK